jgi:hypothetical protein
MKFEYQDLRGRGEGDEMMTDERWREEEMEMRR